MPRISYPLVTTIMTEKEWKGMQVKIDKVYLPRVGLNRLFPLAILNEPA